MKIEPLPNIRPEPGQRVRVRLFMPEFHEAVRTYRKRMTLRPPGKQDFRPGDLLVLRGWSGKPYRSPQVHLGVGVLTAVDVVRVWRGGVIGAGWEAEAGSLSLEAFAQLDGFAGWEAMRAFFQARYALPLLANAIRWEPAPVQPELPATGGPEE